MKNSCRAAAEVMQSSCGAAAELLRSCCGAAAELLPKQLRNGSPGPSGGKVDHVLLCECDHRADELIGLKVDVSGELIADFELVFVQEA